MQHIYSKILSWKFMDRIYNILANQLNPLIQEYEHCFWGFYKMLLFYENIHFHYVQIFIVFSINVTSKFTCQQNNIHVYICNTKLFSTETTNLSFVKIIFSKNYKIGHHENKWFYIMGLKFEEWLLILS